MSTGQLALASVAALAFERAPGGAFIPVLEIDDVVNGQAARRAVALTAFAGGGLLGLEGQPSSGYAFFDAVRARLAQANPRARVSDGLAALRAAPA